MSQCESKSVKQILHCAKDNNSKVEDKSNGTDRFAVAMGLKPPCLAR
jgi:hypothetical protein